MSKREREVLEALRELGVWSARKRRELASILLHLDPPHLKRVYLGAFLRYVLGMDISQAADFIGKYCAWVDFDRRITERNLRGIHKRKGSSNGPKSDGSKSSGPTSNKPEVSRGYERDLGKIGTETWVGRCSANGYCLEWHRVFLLG